MTPKPLAAVERAPTAVRAFPWFCPRCRRKEIRRATISFQCQRLYERQPIAIVLANLAVPRCDNCGELVFDYEAEDQINRAYQAHLKRLKKLRPKTTKKKGKHRD